MALPALTLWALIATGHVTTLIVFALVLARGSVLAIDNPRGRSFVMELVGHDRIVNAVALNSVIVHTAASSARAGGRGDRRPRRRPVFRAQRAELRRDAGRAAGDGPRAAADRAARQARAAATSGSRSATSRARRRCGSRSARWSWSARSRSTSRCCCRCWPTDLARHRDDLRADDDGDGRRLGVGALHHEPARARVAALIVGAATASACSSCWPPSRPRCRCRSSRSCRSARCRVTFAAGVNSSMQLAAAPSMRGRVMSLYSVVFLGSTPIGAPLVGWLAEVASPRAGLALGGAAALVAAAGARIAYAKAMPGATAPRPAAGRRRDRVAQRLAQRAGVVHARARHAVALGDRRRPRAPAGRARARR